MGAVRSVGSSADLVLTDVVKHYGVGGNVVRAVDGVSLRAGPGEFVALYGPSGSGKTTLLLMMASLLAVDSGTIMFGGRDVSCLSSRDSALYRRRELGFVSQSFHLIASASAIDNAGIKLFSDGYTLREARRHVRPLLERVGLGERLLHRAAVLSMGERQRVTVARALAGKPRLLLADEPTGNLDSARTRETLGLLRDICRAEKIPGVIVTHDTVTREYADRVYWLRDGRLHDKLDSEF
jgi:putative ABC transport system ATP-binding protein